MLVVVEVGCRLAWAWADKLAWACMLVWEEHKMALVEHRTAWVVHRMVLVHHKTVFAELFVVVELSVIVGVSVVSVRIHQL